MSLLFDQNISFRILRNIKDIFPEAVQVRELGLENQSDLEIWNYAKTKNLCIVSFDSDFNDLSILNGHPPKVLWIRSQDQSTLNIEKLMRDKVEEISGFLKNSSDFGCLEIIG